MGALDGTVLVPEEFRERIPQDPLQMTVQDLSLESAEWLRAVRGEIKSQSERVFADMDRVLDKAGDRALTRNQRDAFEGGERDVKALAELRERIDTVLTAPAATPTAHDAVATPIPANRSGEISMTSTVPTHRGALLGPETRMADYLRTRGRIHDEDPKLNAGKILRGIVLGRWEGADTERRAMAEGTGSAGGYLVPTILSSEIIDLARNKAQVMRAGARLFPMDSEVENVPRQISDVVPTWRLENAQISQSGPTFDMVTFTARSLACVSVISRELLEDAKQDVDGLVKNSIAKAIALELDRVSLYGSGVAPEPHGLKGATNVPTTSLGTNGADPTWDNISNAVQTVRASNFEPTGVIDNPRTEGELARLKDLQDRYLQPPIDIAGLPRFPTNQIPTDLTEGTASTASDIFVGQWDQLWIGSRTELQLQVLVERYADYGQVGVLAWWRGDVQVAQPLAFDILTGAL